MSLPTTMYHVIVCCKRPIQEPEFSQYFPPHLDPRNRAIHELNRSWLKILALCPEHPKRDHNLKFVPLSETASVPVCFIWESPPRARNLQPATCKRYLPYPNASKQWMHLTFGLVLCSVSRCSPSFVILVSVSDLMLACTQALLLGRDVLLCFEEIFFFVFLCFERKIFLSLDRLNPSRALTALLSKKSLNWIAQKKSLCAG